MKFTNKETYLAYRSNWKAEYKTLSKQIHDIKHDRWLKSRAQSYQGFGELNYKIRGMEQKATNLLEELKLAKAESNRQYLATKQNLVIAA